LASASLCLINLVAMPVAAQTTWPTKPVKVVVPAPAGSSLDVIVRGMSETLSKRWGQPLVVDNKPGAGGTIGMDLVAKAPADGYTLGIGFNGPIAFGPFMFKKNAIRPLYSPPHNPMCWRYLLHTLPTICESSLHGLNLKATK
jgi:tripartite-type tricarboxylate transporter receptor subunit TctC